MRSRPLGSFDARALSHGDCRAALLAQGWKTGDLNSYGVSWRYGYSVTSYAPVWVKKYGSVLSPACKDLAVMGQYAYRNAALWHMNEGGTVPRSAPMYWIRPKIRGYAGCPIFKTPKLLGGRSIVSDNWTRCRKMVGEECYTGNEPTPGMGAYGHRDGYNLLYGDSSARWYGDPQQRIQYLKPTGGHVNTWRKSSYSSNCLVSSGINETSYRYHRPPITNNPSGVEAWQAAWHQFDVSHGIDNVDIELQSFPASWPGWPPE